MSVPSPSHSPVVGRLAPSPTGLLHVGHARSFVLAWASARAQGGEVRLRLEDLDGSRVKPGMVEACLEDLRWLGLDWDGALLVQSERDGVLRAAANELLGRGLAYPCVCTRREVEAARSAPHAGEEGPAYPGTCRGLYATVEEARAASGREPALRVRAPEHAITIHDELHGEVTEDLRETVGDFPITSRDGQVAYQLAVVVDDAAQGVTEVLRGDDLLASTPRQAWLQELLGLPRPSWIHVPLVTDGAGQRLAKRHDALAIAAVREAGVAPERFVAWCARSAGLAVGSSATPREVTEAFGLGRLTRSVAVFDEREIDALGEG